MFSHSKVLAVLAVAGATMSGAAHAGGNVYWSIGIDAPLGGGASIGTVISNGPAYRAAPVYVQPAPVYVQPAHVYVPAPVYVRPAPVVYAPPVYVAPRPVYVQPRLVYVRPAPIVHRGWAPPRHARGHWKQRRGDRWGPVAYDGRGGRYGRD